VAFIALAVIGVGYAFVEVAGRTLLQRLGSDEVLSRVFGIQETLRLGGMALGSIAAPALVALLGIEGALMATGAFLPLLVLVLWRALRGFEAGAPVPERRYELLRESPIFMSLPIATLERVAHDLAPVTIPGGDDVFRQGADGDRFYLIDSGEVEVTVNGASVRVEEAGESFGEIALLKECSRTATVTATRDTELLALTREQFLRAVTGQARSSHTAREVAEARLAGDLTAALAPDGSRP
jgi:hypothetical protein